MAFRHGRGEGEQPRTLSPEDIEAWRRRVARERVRAETVHAPRVFLLTLAVVLVIWLAYLLSAALLAVGSQFPGLTVTAAEAATSLGCATPACATTTPQDFEYTAPTNAWAVVGVRSSTGGGNANLCVYRDAALIQELACSTQPLNTAVDFVAIDYHHTAGGGLDYARAERVSGTGALCTNFDCGNSVLGVNGTPISTSWPANQVVRVFNLVAGAGTYRVGVAITSGTADLGIAVFKSGGQADYAAGRGGAAAEADVRGAGLGEGLYFSSATADTFALVVWSNTAAGTANYRVEFRSAKKLNPNSASDEPGLAVADFLYLPPDPRGWSVVALRPQVAVPTPDADLKAYTRPDYLTQLERSSAEPGVVDFMVADHANVPRDTVSVLMVSLGPLGGYKLDWTCGPPAPPMGVPTALSVGPHVGLAWTMDLLAGVEYRWKFEPTAGTKGDAAFGLYGPTLLVPQFTWGTRADSLAGSDIWAESATGWAGGNGIESFTYTPQVSGSFLLYAYQKRTQNVAGTLTWFPTSLLGAPDPGAAAGAAFAAPWPSPARAGESLRFAFAMPVAGTARLVVHDARGRAVRRLVDGPLAGGPAVATWDGRLADGTAAPPGLYFARLERAGVAPAVRRCLWLD